MNTSELIVQLVDKLVWPTTAITIILISKKEIKRLIPQIKKAKISQLELEFDKSISEIDSILKKESTEKKDWYTHLIKTAQKTPKTATINAWNGLERRCIELIKTANISIDSRSNQPYKDIQKALQENRLLDNSKIRIFDELRTLRNKVTHAENYEITSDQAISYITIVKQLTDHLDGRVKN